MFDSSAVVTCGADLEAILGARPGVMMLKSIHFLDEHCERLLAYSPFVVIGTTTGDGARQTIVLGGEPGLATPRSDTELELGNVAGNDVLAGASAGLIALVPGYGEMLRVNGRRRVKDDLVTLDVEEALLHCADPAASSAFKVPFDTVYTTPLAPAGHPLPPTAAGVEGDEVPRAPRCHQVVRAWNTS